MSNPFIKNNPPGTLGGGFSFSIPGDGGVSSNTGFSFGQPRSATSDTLPLYSPPAYSTQNPQVGTPNTQFGGSTGNASGVPGSAPSLFSTPKPSTTPAGAPPAFSSFSSLFGPKNTTIGGSTPGVPSITVSQPLATYAPAHALPPPTAGPGIFGGQNATTPTSSSTPSTLGLFGNTTAPSTPGPSNMFNATPNAKTSAAAPTTQSLFPQVSSAKNQIIPAFAGMTNPTPAALNVNTGTPVSLFMAAPTSMGPPPTTGAKTSSVFTPPSSTPAGSLFASTTPTATLGSTATPSTPLATSLFASTTPTATLGSTAASSTPLTTSLFASTTPAATLESTATSSAPPAASLFSPATPPTSIAVQNATNTTSKSLLPSTKPTLTPLFPSVTPASKPLSAPATSAKTPASASATQTQKTVSDPSAPDTSTKLASNTVNNAQAAPASTSTFPPSKTTVSFSQTNSHPPIPSLKDRSLEEITNKWISSVESYKKEFYEKGRDISKWDIIFTEQSEKVVRLSMEVKEAERTQDIINNALEQLEVDQDQMEKLFDFYEHSLAILERESLEAQPPDAEREQLFNMIVTLSSKLTEMEAGTKAMVSALNNASKKIENISTDSHFTSIIRILNEHLQLMRWVDTQTAVLSEKINNVRVNTRAFRANDEEDEVMRKFGNSHRMRFGTA